MIPDPAVEVSGALKPFDAAALALEPSTVYALTRDLRISYVNPAWLLFASANGASWTSAEWGVGTWLMDAIPAPLQPFYQKLFEGALELREVVEHDYECSSPSLRRLYRMRVLPCDSGELLVVHSLLLATPHESAGVGALDARYRSASGVITQCCHCRRVRRAASDQTWDWVPDYVAHMPQSTSHGLCRLCLDYYYPESGDAGVSDASPGAR